MLLIKMVELNDVPYYSLNGWELHGTPIIKQSIYGSTEDYRGYHIQGSTVNTVLQPMKKELYIVIENHREIQEFLYNLYYTDTDHNSYRKLVNELMTFRTIKSIDVNPNKSTIDMIEIKWS